MRLQGIEEVREIQTALGMVAAGAGICIIPAASQRQRPDDVVYRMIADENATSPIIMSYRRDDARGRTEAIKQLIREMYADNPPGSSYPACASIGMTPEAFPVAGIQGR